MDIIIFIIELVSIIALGVAFAAILYQAVDNIACGDYMAAALLMLTLILLVCAIILLIQEMLIQ